MLNSHSAPDLPGFDIQPPAVASTPTKQRKSVFIDPETMKPGTFWVSRRSVPVLMLDTTDRTVRLLHLPIARRTWASVVSFWTDYRAATEDESARFRSQYAGTIAAVAGDISPPAADAAQDAHAPVEIHVHSGDAHVHAGGMATAAPEPTLASLYREAADAVTDVMTRVDHALAIESARAAMARCAMSDPDTAEWLIAIAAGLPDASQAALTSTAAGLHKMAKTLAGSAMAPAPPAPPPTITVVPMILHMTPEDTAILETLTEREREGVRHLGSAVTEAITPEVVLLGLLRTAL